MTFSLELRWRVLSVAGLAAVFGLSTAFVSNSLLQNEVLPAIAASLLAIVSALGFVRVWRVGATDDDKQLTVRGMLWTRVIPRGSITSVDREPNHASVTWSDSRGRSRSTPLTAFWGNNYGWLPAEGEKARPKFLNRMAGWARK